MCGILGYYKEGGLSGADIRRGLHALQDLSPRGPDGEGVLLIDTRSGAVQVIATDDTPPGTPAGIPASEAGESRYDLFLGHRRLSIFDLSIDGHQPMCDEAGNALVFNGEVYNWPEIRKDLEHKGYRFQTGTDTEVILAAFREQGPECIRAFNGMWSFIMWDAKGRKLWIANDRVGIKQLYYYNEAGSLVLASEIKAIRRIAGEGLSLDRGRCRVFLDRMVTDYDYGTLFEEVKRFPPAHYSHCAAGDFGEKAFQSFWEPDFTVRKFANDEEAIAEFAALIEDSIRLRMRSDVEWGTTLSGGLDSSTIVYTAARLRKAQGMDAPIHTFSAIFPGRAGDESEFVRFIEKDLGTHAEYVDPLEVFNFEDYLHFLQAQDMPVITGSMYAQWCVMRLAGASEVKVLLDGQGSDELFGGYHHHFYRYASRLMLRGSFGQAKRMVREYAELKGIDPGKVMRTVRNDAKFQLKNRFFGPPEAPEVFKKGYRARNLREYGWADLRHMILPALLRFEDRSSMAFSLESRLPFLDHRIVEFGMRLPDEFRIRDGWQKWIVRKAADVLPDQIRWRKDKKGFTVPQDEWVQQYKSEFLELANGLRELDLAFPRGAKRAEDLSAAMLFKTATFMLWYRGRA